jgi:hypothetical protein
VEELKIPTRLIDVELLTADGDRARGAMFHPESLYESGGADDILEDLVDDRLFVPFLPEAAQQAPVLVNKRQIVSVGLPGLDVADLSLVDEPDDNCVRHCTLTLTVGGELSGRPVVETPATASRLLDKFNAAPRFVPFLTDEGLVFVQHTYILRIRRTV